MLKVSFKRNSKKTEVFNGSATIVTLKGTVKLPKHFFETVPNSVMDWAYAHPTVVFYDGIDRCYVIAKGKSTCAADDVFDAVKGERIAEARAKIRLYKFMRSFCTKTHDAWSTLLTGTPIAAYDYSISAPSINRSYFKYCALLSKEKAHLDKLLQQ